MAGNQALAGRLEGEAARPAFEAAVTRAPEEALVVLDFTGVELVTPSYFLGALEWVWLTLIAERVLFPVLANLGHGVREDVEVAVRAAQRKTVIGRWEAGTFSEAEPVNLDDVERATFERVTELGEATAADLSRIDPRIQPTAWSNRLAALYRVRLLSRRREGKQLFYTLPWRT